MSDSKNDFLVPLFSNSADHIQFLKKQQWTITNYCLLLYAAIVAVFQSIKAPVACWEKGVLFAIASVLCIIGWILILKFEETIKDHQKIIKNIYEFFSAETKIAFVNIPSGSHPIDVPLIKYSLIASLLIGLFIVVWILYRV